MTKVKDDKHEVKGVYMPTELWKGIKQLGREDRRSISYMMREAARAYLDGRAVRHALPKD